MKNLRIIILLAAVMICTDLMSQVGIGTTSPNPSTLLDVAGTTRGVLLPSNDYSAITSISNPAKGLILFCTDCGSCQQTPGCLFIYEGEGWHCAGTQPVIHKSCSATRYYYPVNIGEYTWLDRNLGAERQARSVNDQKAYGSLFQWGRFSDGHECINWTDASSGTPQTNTTTAVLCSFNSATNPCGNSVFVTGNNWTSQTASQTGWWTSSRGNADPCPAGYRLPTDSELQALKSSFTAANGPAAFSSAAKLVYAGYRNKANGTIAESGTTSGYYWSSTSGSGQASALQITGASATIQNSYFGNGLSVRCIAQ